MMALANRLKSMPSSRLSSRLVALALGGLYHGYRQVRNRKVNEALVQGVESARPF